MAEASSHVKNGRPRGAGPHDSGRRLHSRNKHWVADGGSSKPNSNHIDSERWERGGHRGGGKGSSGTKTHRFPNASLMRSRLGEALETAGEDTTDVEGEQTEHEPEGGEIDMSDHTDDEPVLETETERETFWKELVKAREVERKRAIAEGKMDDPLVPKRLEDAISMVGTCMDMCPRFERYRREREGTLYQWEMIPGTKRVDHKLAVKQYERAVGDKTLPSDLRPPEVLKRTLDYLFHNLLPRGGFDPTHDFIRDRSRAVRNDFTVQHESGPLAMQCHDRCARFHILSLHLQRDNPKASMQMEEQQLMYTLQSLKEFYEDQRGRYRSPTELEMRVYHRLIHIRDQQERREDIPADIVEHPVFKLTTSFRLHVQAKSAPIRKNSPLVVDVEGMQIFGELATVLREQGSLVMIYLVACILERLFGKDTIDDIEAIRGDLSIPDIIDGISASAAPSQNGDALSITDVSDSEAPDPAQETQEQNATALPSSTTANGWSGTFGVSMQSSGPSQPVFGVPFSNTSEPTKTAQAVSAFSNLSSVPNAFANQSAFGGSAFAQPATTNSVFGGVFGTSKPALPSPSLLSNTSANVSEAPASASASLFSLPPVGSPFASSSSSSLDAARLTSTSLSVFPSVASPAASAQLAASLSQLQSLNTAAPTFTPSWGQPRHSPTLAGSSGTPSASGAHPSDILTHADSIVKTKKSSSLSKSGASFDSPQTNRPPLSQASPAPLFKSSSESSISSFTPPNRLTINTSSTSNVVLDGPRTPLSQPPALVKRQTIDLPTTPSMASITPNLGSKKLSISLPKSILNSSLNTPVDALSPLALSSPSLSRAPSTLFLQGKGSPAVVTPTPKVKSPPAVQGTPSNAMLSTDNKDKTMTQEAELEQMAQSLARRGLLVRDCFERWQKRTVDKAAWLEACMRSEAYSQKVHRERSARTRSIGIPASFPSSELSLSTSPKRKPKPRVSAEYKAPRNDEEFASRLRENHEEQERRWALGSFLRVLKTHVDRKMESRPSTWNLWISTNAENDGTAIWVERKFDVPDSGHWESENIFSIPVAAAVDSSLASPGLIVFESTPLDRVSDEIERKYRVLDDCSRLRDIIDALPADRHYVPSLLVINWSTVDALPHINDFINMITKLRDQGTLRSFSEFAVASSTTDLDNKFTDVLTSLELDCAGQLVQSITMRDLVAIFASCWRNFCMEWIELCSSTRDFDWVLYAQLLQSAIALCNTSFEYMSGLIKLDFHGVLPPIDVPLVDSSESTYEAVLSWLDSVHLANVSHHIREDLMSHRNIGEDFPSSICLDYLQELCLIFFETSTSKSSETPFYVLKLQLEQRADEYGAVVQSSGHDLRRVYSYRTRRSPKRRGSHDMGDSTSSSPIASKRRRLSVTDESSAIPSLMASPESTGPLSPSPSIATSIALDERPPVVTVAMLKALTENLKQKYTTT